MIHKILIFIVLFTFSFWHTYAKNDLLSTSTVSIKELSKNIEKLKNENQEFDEKIKQTSQEYWDLINYIKKDLTDNELLEIKLNLNSYLENRAKIEKEIEQKIPKLQDISKQKNDLIDAKTKFYDFLQKYIDPDKKQEFQKYSEFILKSTKQKKDLVEDLLKNQQLLDQKVDLLKWKIENHKENLTNSIENSISKNIEIRIDTIDKNQKYSKLSKETKNKIYLDFIEKIKQKQKELKDSNLSDNYKEIRNSIFEKMIKEIDEKIIK